jgi:hypothetical protein
MRFLLQFAFIIIVSYILELFFPWYTIAIAAFILGYALKSQANFLAGFLAIGVLWIAKAWLTDSVGDSDLANRVAHIFTLPNKSLLYAFMALVGGLVGGFAALTGALLRRSRPAT